MSIFGVLSNATIFYNTYDVSGTANTIDTQITVADKDTTTFGSGNAMTRTGGLIDASGTVDGYAEYGSALTDETFWNGLGTNTHVFTVTTTGTQGDPAVFFQSLLKNYHPIKGQVGDVAGYHAEFVNGLLHQPVNGKLLLAKTTLSSAATTTGTITNLGATSSTQRVRAALHVFSAGGSGSPTLDVKIQSAALVGFGSQTDRFTFTQTTTTANDQYPAAVSGAITDQFWRVSVTTGGTTPAYTLAVVLGIQ
jgi:hypothetical protein